MRKLILLVTLGIVLVALAGAAASRQDVSSSPKPRVEPSETPTALAVPPTLSAPSPSPAPTQTLTPEPTQPPPTPQPRPTAVSVAPPVRLEIPAIGVDASFEYLGLTPTKAMDAPKNPDKLGWYKYGPKPGEKGNALVDGHVDWAGKIRAFWGLKNLKPGDSVIVTDADGKKHEFVVEWSKWYDANAPVNDVFAPSDQAELTMVTCGGEFNHVTHQYLSRLVVRAKLK